MARKYRTVIPYYRLGIMYPPGSIVEIPDDERPSRTWIPVEEPSPAPFAPTVEATPPTVRRAKRPSDSEPTVA